MADDRLITWLRDYAAADELRGLAADALWARVRDTGCDMAFRVVVERLGPKVMQVCRGVIGDRHLAEDAFQDVFVLLFAKRTTIPTHAAAAAWVRTAAGWTARRHRRTRRRKAGREQALVDAAAEGKPTEPAEFDRLAAAVAALPAHYRRPLELVYYDGLSHKAAAAELGLSEGTVNSYVARGVAKLRAKLGAPAVALTATLAAPAPAVPREIIARFAGPLPAVGTGWGVGKLALLGVLFAGTAAGGAGAWWGTSVPRPAPPPGRTGEAGGGGNGAGAEPAGV